MSIIPTLLTHKHKAFYQITFFGRSNFTVLKRLLMLICFRSSKTNCEQSKKVKTQFLLEEQKLFWNVARRRNHWPIRHFFSLWTNLFHMEHNFKSYTGPEQDLFHVGTWFYDTWTPPWGRSKSQIISILLLFAKICSCVNCPVAS